MTLAPPSEPGAVVTHHLNTFASGVARFNEILAEHLGVPLLGIFDAELDVVGSPLFSFKSGELSPSEQARVLAGLPRRQAWSVFLHDWRGLELERALVQGAATVWAGNREVRAAVEAIRGDVQEVWTPGLLMDQRRFQPAELSVFSFGMAHKIRTDMFRRLRTLLERSELTYRLYISTANHETSSIGEAQLVYEEMHQIFPAGLYFMGNLSDVAVYNHLRTTTFFAAFFERGVRANNTSVAAAMEQGSVVITNLDDYSPAHFKHMRNVVDINVCEELPDDPLTLKRLSVAAMELSRAHSWERLATFMRAASTDVRLY